MRILVRAFIILAAPLAAACGGSALTQEEAAALLPKAIEGTLSKSIPALTYCMTATPDFSFKNMSQTDLVATFQNLADKSTLYEPLAAGLMKIDLKELPFNPSRPAPDPSCEATHAQAKAAGYQPSQMRLAVVTTALTKKAMDAGLTLGAPVAVATREFVAVTKISPVVRNETTVTYSWRWKPTASAEKVAFSPDAAKEATARFRKVDGNWRVDDAGIPAASSR